MYNPNTKCNIHYGTDSNIVGISFVMGCSFCFTTYQPFSGHLTPNQVIRMKVWLVGWVSWHINLYRLFNAKYILYKSVLFQTIQFNMNTV